MRQDSPAKNEAKVEIIVSDCVHVCRVVDVEFFLLFFFFVTGGEHRVRRVEVGEWGRAIARRGIVARRDVFQAEAGGEAALTCYVYICRSND